MTRTRAALAILPLLALPLSACGGGGSSSSGSTAATKASAIHPNGTYASLEQLRAAVREVGVQCPDASWKPAAVPTDENMTGDGWCGDTVRLATTKTGDVATSGAMVAFTLASANKSLESTDGFPAKYVEGANWIVQVPTDSAQQSVLKKMGGKDPIGNPGGGTSTPGGPDDTGVTKEEKHFVDAERQALPGTSLMSGANIKKIGDYACDQIETVAPSELDSSVAQYAEGLDDSISWSEDEGKTFVETANREWCSDKTPAA